MDKIFLVSQIDGNRTFKELEINDFIKEKNGKIKSLSTFGDNLCVVIETPEENKQKETAGDLLLKILFQLPHTIECDDCTYTLVLVPFGNGISYVCWNHPDGIKMLDTKCVKDIELLETWHFLSADLRDLIKSI